MTSLRGAGHFVPWDGGCLLIGRAHDLTPLHAHYALQIGVGRTTGICFRATDAAPWTSYELAIIPSRQPHAMDATRVEASAVLFIEPETPAGRSLTERYLQDGICNVAHGSVRACADSLFAAWDTRQLSAVVYAARDLLGALTGGVSPVTATDARVQRAIAFINAHLTEQVTLDAAAAEACLSASRFRHLFIEETGMAFRPFVLWRRFLRAWELIGGGAAISTAAHAAGFADAAHFTRTSRQMFGFPPSALEFALPLADGASMTPPAPSRT